MALFALAVTILWVVSRFRHDFQVCRTSSHGGAAAIEKVCGPIPVQDFLPLLLLFAVLIWPDVSEIDIRGLGRIVRRLDETNKKQEEIVGTQERIMAQLRQVQIASQRVDVNIDTALARQVDDLREELARLAGGERGVAVPDTLPDAGSDRESVRSQLLDSWRKLEPWAEFGRRQLDERFSRRAEKMLAGEPEEEVPQPAYLLVRRVQAAAGGELDTEEVRQWYAERQPQIETVRATLNQLDALPQKTLEDALVLAQRALDDLRRRGLVSSG